MTGHQPPPGPGEHHARLEPLVGTFRADVRIWAGPGDPLRSTGTMVNTWDLGGRFLAQRYTRDPGHDPVPSFEGRGYWGYNDLTGRYEGFWIDTASNAMMIEAGDVDDDGTTWTMTGGFASRTTGEALTTRTLVRVLDDNRHTMEQFTTGPDGRELKTVEITYERSG
jgi:hypothetical protein